MTNPEAYASAYEDQKLWPLERFRPRLEEHHVFGAFDDTQLVGMIVFQRDSGRRVEHKGYVLSFFVEPVARGKGAGKALMDVALKTAREHVEQVLIGVAEQNEIAKGLYLSFGFVTYGIEPRAIKANGEYINEVVMIKIFE